MALQVWLPLNGNLNNQGLNSITVTDGGATVNNNGKIGKCYYFDGTDDYINLGNLNNYFDGSPFTICFWIKSLENATRGVIFSSYALPSGSNFFCIEVNSNSVTNNSLRFDWNGSPDTHAAAGSIPYNEWAHIAVVYNGTNATQIYKNGSLINTLTMTLTSLSSTNNFYLGRDSRTGATAFNGYLNDFRIYDHALSPKEIEILSRGLVAHYPLNGGGRGGDNLLKNTGDLTLWAKEAGITTTWDSEKNLYKIVDSTHTSNRWGIYQDINIEANTSYTITCTLNGDNCAVAFGFYDSSTSFPGNLITVTDSTTKRLSYTVTSGASSTKARVYLNMNCANSATKTAWFGTPKVEKGSVSTPWIPNSADTAYSAMGYNSTTEYDVSGYGNNGVKNNITYNSNTARYNVCSKFNGSSTRIAFSDIYVGNEWSYGLWVKAPQSTTRGWENVVMLNETGSDSDTQLSFWLNLKANGLQSTANKQYNSTIPYPNDGNWHHFFATFDGSNLKTYIDGELVNTKAITNAWFQRTHLTIGAYRTGDNTYTSYSLCDLSDFRLYATALSAEQVAELYNTAVSVANNGTLLGYELVEV